MHKDSLIVYAWRKLDVWRSSSHRQPPPPHHQEKQQHQNHSPFGLCWQVGGGGGGSPTSACFLPWSSSVDLVEEDDEAEQQVPGVVVSALLRGRLAKRREKGLLNTRTFNPFCVGTWKGCVGVFFLITGDVLQIKDEGGKINKDRLEGMGGWARKS